MTATEVSTVFREKIVPQMQEMGVSGFVMAAYVSDGEGVMSRVVFVNGGKNVAIQDGLHPMVVGATVWQRGNQP